MIKIEIPGYDTLEIENLVLDYNGTIACDGKVVRGVMEKLQVLRTRVKVYILTADTYGSVKKEFENTGIDVHILTSGNGTQEKSDFVKSLGAMRTMCMGNGSNDAKMLEESRLSIGVIGGEGCSMKALAAADIVVKDVLEGLTLLEEPLKIKATLRE